DGGSGAGWRRRRGPGALGRPPGDRRNRLTWANTDSEGGGGRPAHLHVARVTWGRASRPRIGPPTPLMGGVRGGRAVQGAGKRGSGAGKGLRRGGMSLSPVGSDPPWSLWVIKEGVGCDPGWLLAGTRHRGRRRGVQAAPPDPPPSLNPTYGTRPLAGRAGPDGEHRPVPSGAVAARLNPHPVRRRARPRRPVPAFPLPLPV